MKSEQNHKKNGTKSVWRMFKEPAPLRVEIVICDCGNKYVKTRTGQTQCLTCVYGSH